MKSKATTLWFIAAVALAATIWILNYYERKGAKADKVLVTGLVPGRVTGLQVIPAGGLEISVTRTNGGWFMQRPVGYPAQAAAVDALLDTLAKLTPMLSLSAGEMSSRKNADAEFGFDNPQFTLDIEGGTQAWHIAVGNKTAPGDGVYVRVVGAAGASVTDTAWLNFLPREAADWRDTSLVDVPDNLDWLVVTNGAQAVELRRDPATHLWRMVRPLSARADNLRLQQAIQQLRLAKITRFVNDDAKADLSGYGLDPALLDVWMGAGTNMESAIHAGKDTDASGGEVFARQQAWHAVVATPKEPLAPWRGAVNDFRDRTLFEFSVTAPVTDVDVRGQYGYRLQQGTNGWTMVGQKFPVDGNQVAALIGTLAGLQVADFVQDVVTASGLTNFGLANPSREVTLRSASAAGASQAAHTAAGDTNSIIGQLMFGDTNKTNEMYAKRGDEDYVYDVARDRLGFLDMSGDFFRDRRIWNFSETNVAEVTLRQNGHTREMTRSGPNDWSLAPGSQGIINPAAVEETVHELGKLTAFAWWGRKFDALQDMGVSTNSLSVTIDLKTGEHLSVSFGRSVPVPSLNANTVFAIVTLQGDQWAFVFPPTICAMVAEYLTIPIAKP